VGPGPATETALLDNAQMSLAYVTVGLSPFLVYGECALGCSTQTPSFQAMLVQPSVSGDAGVPYHVALAQRPGGGVVMAIAADVAGPRSLIYGECASACTASPNWSFVLLSNVVADARPSITTYAGVTAIAYGSNLGAYFAECDGSCTNSANWWKAQALNMGGIRNVGVGLSDGGQGLYRRVFTDQTTYAGCPNACQTAGAWLPGSSPLVDVGESLVYFGNPVARVAGAAPGGALKYSQCPNFPCSNMWSPTSTLIDVPSPGQIDLDVQVDGTVSIAYSLDGGLFRALGGGGGQAWTTAPITACGAQLQGTQPSQTLSAGGGVGVLFTTSTEVRYHAP
jgi:hypothetical protein